MDNKTPTITSSPVSVASVTASIQPLGILVGLASVVVEFSELSAARTLITWEEVLSLASKSRLPPGSWLLFSGAEPSEQLTPGLVLTAKEAKWKVAVETNGSTYCPALWLADHVILSPRPDLDVVTPPKWVSELRVTMPASLSSGYDWTDEWLDELARAYPYSCWVVPLVGHIERGKRFVASRGGTWRLGMRADTWPDLSLPPQGQTR